MKVHYKSEHDVFEALKTKFSGNEYVLLPQVASGTGSMASRTADVIMMNMWPSRGLEIWGMEIKVSRADWLKELKDPSKSSAVQKYCDRWFVVEGQRGIVAEAELPKTWGLISAWGDGLRVTVQAPVLEPVDISRSFLASILRQLSRFEVPESEVEKRVAEEVSAISDKRYEDGKRDALYTYQRQIQDYESLKKRVEEFEKASGIRLGGWSYVNPSVTGSAVQKLINNENELKTSMRQLQYIKDRVSEILRQCDPSDL